MENKITSYFLEGQKESSFSLKTEKDVLFLVQDNSEIVLNINEFNCENKISFKVGNNSKIKLNLAIFDAINSLEINADVSRGSTFDTIVADFSKNSSSFKEFVNLMEEDASSLIKLATLSQDKDYKKYDISFDHLKGKTKSSLECYGVSKDSSTIKIDGTSHIYKDAVKANASQNVRVILFDDESQAIGNPILKIDCNDIIAKHGCAIGSLREEHLYYLLSRGIEEKEARNLLTLGYLLPITKEFNEENANKLNEVIGGSF